MTKLVIATHNVHKLKEFQASFAGMSINGEEWALSSASDHGIGDIAETGTTFRDNALLKAQTVMEKTGLAALGDDSGLIVEALSENGVEFPGLHTKRFADGIGGFDPAVVEILRRLDGRPAKVWYQCTLALVRPNYRPLITEGRVMGTLVYPNRGTGHFGFDPWFLPDDQPTDDVRTFGQMTLDEKRALDHRTRALKTMLAILAAQTQPETC